jgi:2'-5' RNA ligase
MKTWTSFDGSTGSYPSANTITFVGELTEDEEEDLERAMSEIERGEAKTFDSLEDALRWLRSN